MHTISKIHVTLIYKLIKFFFSDENYIWYSLSCGCSLSNPNKVPSHTLKNEKNVKFIIQ